MYRSFVDNIRSNGWIPEGRTVILGVSGGCDSMVMLDLFRRLAVEMEIYPIVAHVNHGMRGAESDADEEFVRGIAVRHDLPFVLETADMRGYARHHGLGEEDAGRRIRYEFFERLRKETDASVIAVAHNANDQTETILMNLIRGTGLRGLAGMEVLRGNIFRPMLGVMRKEIEDYASEHGISYREDHTNFESVYRRNSIRNELLPLIRSKYNPSIEEAVLRMGRLVRGELLLLDRWADDTLKSMNVQIGTKSIRFEIAAFLKLERSGQQRILYRCIESLKGSVSGFESNHIEQFIRVAHGSSGKAMTIHGVECRVVYDTVVLSVQGEKDDIESKELVIPYPYTGNYRYGEYQIRIECYSDSNRIHSALGEVGNPMRCLLNKRLMHGDLIVRSRRSGDRLIPFGMKGSKKLKDLFIDNKISSEVRDKIPIFDVQGDIIWVGGIRRSDLYTVEDEMSELLSIELIKGEED